MPDLIGGRVDIETLGKEAFIAPADGGDSGYWGYSPKTDRERYTIAGVTGVTAGTTDAPDPDAARRVKSSHEPVRGAKP